MKPSSRLYYCALCHSQCLICSSCDRGQIYCGYQCAQFSRTKSKREAEKRYQNTSRGRMNHALRQARYRNRLLKKVTDHTSTPLALSALIKSVKNKTKNTSVKPSYPLFSCCYCHEPVSPWVRHGFLQQNPALTRLDWASYFKPP